MVWQILFLFASVAAIIAGVISNLLANAIEKSLGKNPKYKRLTNRQRLALFGGVFVLLNLPSFFLHIGETTSAPLVTTESLPTTELLLSERQIITDGDTGVFFNGDLFVTADEVFANTNSQYANVIIGSPDYQNTQASRLVQGDTRSYTARAKYSIRILRFSWEWNSAAEVAISAVEVMVTKLP